MLKFHGNNGDFIKWIWRDTLWVQQVKYHDDCVTAFSLVWAPTGKTLNLIKVDVWNWNPVHCILLFLLSPFVYTFFCCVSQHLLEDLHIVPYISCCWCFPAVLAVNFMTEHCQHFQLLKEALVLHKCIKYETMYSVGPAFWPQPTGHHQWAMEFISIYFNKI